MAIFINKTNEKKNVNLCNQGKFVGILVVVPSFPV